MIIDCSTEKNITYYSKHFTTEVIAQLLLKKFKSSVIFRYNLLHIKTLGLFQEYEKIYARFLVFLLFIYIISSRNKCTN